MMLLFQKLLSLSSDWNDSLVNHCRGLASSAAIQPPAQRICLILVHLPLRMLVWFLCSLMLITISWAVLASSFAKEDCLERDSLAFLFSFCSFFSNPFFQFIYIPCVCVCLCLRAQRSSASSSFLLSQSGHSSSP